MKIEVRIAQAQDGGDDLAASLMGNTGRLRHAGVRCINQFFPQWQRLHDAVMQATEGPSHDRRDAIAALNQQVVGASIAAGVRSAVVLIDLPAGPVVSEADLVGRVAVLLQGLIGSNTVLHLVTNDPYLQAALAHDGTDPTAIMEKARGFAAHAERQARLNAALLQRFDKCHAVLRLGPASMTDARDAIREFLRDIGVSPEAMKLQFGTMLGSDAALAVTNAAERCRATSGDAPEARVLPPASPDPAAALPLTVFFMVEPGPLEAQAHLLVASLMVHCRDRFEMVGFCRHDRITGLHPDTRRFLVACGVDLRPITNSFADGYPAGNKLIAAASVRAKGWALFLDTDMCLMRDSSFMRLAVADRTAVCLDSVTGWARNDAEFAVVANALGCASLPPKQRLWGGEVARPSYNAGLVLFAPAAEGGRDFGQRWLDNALTLDRDPHIPNKRPWLDTIALAGTIAKEGNLRPLPLEWNCTTRMADAQTRVLHYHGLRQIRGHGWTERVSAILAASPSPFDSFAAFMHAHKAEMRLAGDVERRAMRHGIQTAEPHGG